MLSGKRIREERKKHGYTQEELGKLLNVSKVSVCGYENGTRTPTLDVFRRLVDVLEITPDYALGNDVDVIYVIFSTPLSLFSRTVAIEDSITSADAPI